jgi:O-antigen ligase
VSLTAQRAAELRRPERGFGAPYPLTRWLAVLTCALAPAYTIRWHVGFYPTTALEAAILLTLLAFAWEELRERRSIEWRSPFTWFGALLVVAAAISVVVAPDRRAALGLFRAYFVEPILFFLVLVTVIRSSRQAFWLVVGLGAGGTVVAIANAAKVLDALRHHAVDTALNAPVAIYQTSNAVALFLIPILAVAGSLLLHSRVPLERRLSALFLAVGGVAVLLSFSRGGYVALFAVAVGLALSHRLRWWFLGAIALVVVVATRVPIIASRLAHEINMNDPNNTLAGRIHLWRVTISMMRDRPLFGTGLSGYAHYMTPWPNGLVQVIYPHNLILNSWVATGVLGVVAFVGLLVQAFRTAWRGWQRSDMAWRPFQLGVLLAMVAIAVHGLVDVPYFKNDLSFEFWVLLSISWAGFVAQRGIAATATSDH